MSDLPGIDDIRSAAQQISGQAVRTPLLESDALNERVGGRVLVKPECLQRTGSFKFRGAYNRLSRIDVADRHKGVVAFSSGNHAQGVALAGKLLGMPVTIVMPSDAPRAKVEGVRRMGGEIVSYDRATGDREAISQELAEKTGGVLVPSYDDRFIIAGQGTIGLEISEDTDRLGIVPDQLVCCTGGGGLIAGTGIAIRDRFPDCALWAAEPEGFDDHRRSLEADKRVENQRRSGSIQDAIITPTPGRLTFEINRHQLTGGVTASDDDTLDAIAFIWKHLKLVAEPGGATAFATLFNGQLDARDKTTIVLITGGNVDSAIFRQALDRI